MPVNANEFHAGYSRIQVCSQSIYQEKYIPGTAKNPGYVKSWTENVEIPCHRYVRQKKYYRGSRNYYQPNFYKTRKTMRISRSNKESSSCNSARTAAGLVGGGLAAALSKQDAYGWSIPLGAILGMGVGGANC
tara:strand:- start:270 stop:668 length:399 start_codon:yes stop_codon:yes gene_type:complete